MPAVRPRASFLGSLVLTSSLLVNTFFNPSPPPPPPVIKVATPPFELLLKKVSSILVQKEMLVVFWTPTLIFTIISLFLLAQTGLRVIASRNIKSNWKSLAFNTFSAVVLNLDIIESFVQAFAPQLNPILPVLDFVALAGASILLVYSFARTSFVNKYLSQSIINAKTTISFTLIIITLTIKLNIILPIVIATKFLANKVNTHIATISSRLFLVNEYYDDESDSDESTPSLVADDEKDSEDSEDSEDDEDEDDVEEYLSPEVIPHRFIPRQVVKPVAVGHQTLSLKTFEKALNHFNWTSFAPITLLEETFEFAVTTEVNVAKKIARKFKNLPAPSVFKSSDLMLLKSTTQTSKSSTGSRLRSISLRDSPRSKRKLNNVVSTSRFNGKRYQVIRDTSFVRSVRQRTSNNIEPDHYEVPASVLNFCQADLIAADIEFYDNIIGISDRLAEKRKNAALVKYERTVRSGWFTHLTSNSN